MHRAARQTFRWQLEWRTALFTAVFVPLFIGLGFWQLARAEEKRGIGARWEAQLARPPVPLETMAAASQEQAYRKVSLQGVFLVGRDFLLDNRIHQGRYGVEVISPFRLAGNGELVLVNRGWLEADPGRRELPEIPVVTSTASLAGYIYVPPGQSYTLGDISSGDGWPRLVQAAEVPALAVLLEEPLFPFTVRLDADSPGALLVDWPLMNARPEKHQAYAVQWFTMAAVLALFFVWRSSNLGALLDRKRLVEKS